MVFDRSLESRAVLSTRSACCRAEKILAVGGIGSTYLASSELYTLESVRSPGRAALARLPDFLETEQVHHSVLGSRGMTVKLL